MKNNHLSVFVLFLSILLIAGCGSSEREFKGLQMTGADDYVELGFTPGFTANDNFTFEAWVKMLGDVDQSTVILGPAKSYAGAYGLFTHFLGKLSFGIRTSENFAIIDSPDFTPNKWHHLAGVFNTSENKAYFYFDGELVASKLLKEGISDLAKNKFVINGKEALQGDGEKKGRARFIISDARIWNTVRDQAQLKENMSKILTGSEPGLIGYWPFNEMEGTIAKDLTQNHNHGTIHGGTWYKGN